MKKVQIYTDGACRGNGAEGNIGGYGIVFIYNQNIKEIKQAFKGTTNNIMELTAVIQGLAMLKEPCEVEIYSDSAYVVNAINQNWLGNWKRNGWKNSQKEQVKNKELWQKLVILMEYHMVKFVKVKGHSDNKWNNRCDELANIAMDELE